MDTHVSLRKQTRTIATSVVVAFLCAGSSSALFAKTCIWTGGGGDNNWSTPGNWGGTDMTALPAEGDSVILLNGGGTPLINNDIRGLTLNSLSFQGDNALKLSGEALSLTAAFTNKVSAGVSTNSVPLIFTGNGDISFSGSVVFECGVTNLMTGKSMYVRCLVVDKGYGAYFNAPYYAPRCSLYFGNHKRKGHIHFCDEVAVKEMYGDGGNNSSANGSVYFKCDKTVFGKVRMNENGFTCAVKNALDPNGVLWWRTWAQKSYSYVDLGGFDQVIDRTYSEDLQNSDAREFKSATPATLTMNATKSGVVNSMFNGRMSICFNPADDGTSLTVSNSVSATSGDIIVSNGTFEVAGVASFKNVGTVEVADGASFVLSSSALNPLGEESVILRLASGSRIILPSGCNLKVAALYVDGVRQDGGGYTAVDLPQLAGSGALIGVKDYERTPLACTWNGGTIEDTSLFTAANWENNTIPDLASGTAAATFAAGTAATVSSTVSMYSLNFTSADFALSGDGLVKLYGGSVAVTANSKATIAVPVQIRKDHSFSIASGATLTLASEITGVKGLDCNIVKHGNAGTAIEFRNARIGCGFTVENGSGAFKISGGGETVFEGPFKLNNNISFKPALTEASTVVFEGGFSWGAAYFQPASGGSSGNPGIWIFRNKPAVCTGSGPLELSSYQTFRFAAQDNRMTIKMGGTYSRVYGDCDYAFSNYTAKINFAGLANTYSFLELNGFDQEVGNLSLEKGSKTQTDPRIRSSSPARFSFSQSSDNINSNVAFTGQIDLVKKGAASMTFARVYDATGTVSVAEGTLAFADNCTAPNVTNVTVAGGTFSLGRPQALAKAVVLEISDDAASIVDLADGVRQRCSALFVGGRRMPSGTYGAAGSGAKYAGEAVAAHFTGGGILDVSGNFTIVVR